MRIAVLVKQIPAFEELELGPDGRLRREGTDLEMNAYCRRAVAQAVLLAQARPATTVTVMTLGPAGAEDTLREALAWGLHREVAIDGVHVSDPALAGSDTIATARALAAALELLGPFDLVLTGRNSVDADTGQVGPQLAELLDLPFATAVRQLELDGRTLHLRCEHDDGWRECDVDLPAALSCAERLCDPAKVPPEHRASVPAERLRHLTARDLGPGPWGEAGSRTHVGRTRRLGLPRAGYRAAGDSVTAQVGDALAVLEARGALVPTGVPEVAPVPDRPPPPTGPTVAVLAEPGRPRHARELLGAAAGLAASIGGRVAAISAEPADPATLAAWGADEAVEVRGSPVEEDVAAAVAHWSTAHGPWAVLTGSTVWGREVAARVAVRLDAGLTGDAVALEIDGDRLVAWKPAFGGQLVAAVTASSPVQMATVRPGVLPARPPRRTAAIPATVVAQDPRGRMRILAEARDDDLDVLAEADAVVGVGQGVDPDEYPALERLAHRLGAELGATRKVTDRGWMPRARQIGITGRSVAPRLFVSIGSSGKFNHLVGVRAAGTILAINPDPEAPVFGGADIGIVGDWREVLPALVDAVERSAPVAPPAVAIDP